MGGRSRSKAISKSVSGSDSCVQPKKDQSSPRGHEADAQTLTGLPHPVQRQREPHHDEAGQGQDVHAEENVPSEHCPLPSVGSCLRVPTLPLWLARATVSIAGRFDELLTVNSGI